MKLKALLLSILFSFGLFFSLANYSPIYAAEVEDAFVAGSGLSKIKEVNELQAAIQREEENSSKLSLPTVGFSLLKTNGAGLLEMVATSDDSGIASAQKAIASIFSNAPASGETYVADLLHNMKLGPAQPAYAQVGGLGFAALEPVLFAWKQFRNIAYLFFIIITLIIGFMIMMRQKIGSQAAVTAQQAIPQIIIALITVTFSYAIAGFMIDLMYILMYLFVGLFPFPDQSGTSIISKNIFTIGADMFVHGVGSANAAVTDFVNGMIANSSLEFIGTFAGLTFAIIIAIAFLFAMVQLFFELLKTYIAIIISIVLAPLLLMMGALPGRNDVFIGWVRGLFGNLIAFPVVLLLIILQRLLTQGTAADGGFLPPFLMGRGNADAIKSLVGLAIMLIAKDLVVQAKKSVNPKGSGIFEQFGSALSSAVSKGWKGGQVVPGLGFTDTNKIPGLKYIGSGQKVTSLAATGAGTAAGAAGGLGRGLWRVAKYNESRRNLGERVMEGARLGGRSVGDLTGSDAFAKNREERKKTSVFTNRDKFRVLSQKEGK